MVRTRATLGCLLGLALIACRADSPKPLFVPAKDSRVLVQGRVERARPGRLRLGFPGVSLRLRFEGSGSVRLRASSNTGRNYLSVRVDGGQTRIIHVGSFLREIPVAQGLSAGEHDIELVSRNETWQGVLSVFGFTLEPDARVLGPPPRPARRLLFIGDSVTCGEGVDRGARCDKHPRDSNADHAYGWLAARQLNAECHLVCFRGRGLVRDWQGRQDILNAPEFVDLALPEAGAERWDPTRYVPDAVLISLGTNDFNLSLGTFPDRAEFVDAYVALVRKLRTQAPEAWILLTDGAIVSDAVRPQRARLREYITETVRRVSDPRVRSFWAEQKLGTECDAHPTAAEHEAMARELIEQLEPLLPQR